MIRKRIDEQFALALYEEYVENWYDLEGNEVESPIVETDLTPEELEEVRRLFGSLFGDTDIFWLKGLESKPFS